MSADNWASCPNCQSEKAYNDLCEEIDNSYGEIGQGLYLELVAKRDNWDTLNNPDLREDYEIGIYDGDFYIIYSAHCDNCNFEFKYNHREKVS